MIDRNSRPAITAVSRRDPRATLPLPWAPGHPPGIQTWRAVVTNGSATRQGRPQTANTFLTMARYMAREKLNAVPAGYRGAHPTQGQGWDGGSPGTRPASLSVRRGISSLPLSDLPWPRPCDCSISAVGTEKFGTDQGKGTG